MLSTIAVYYSDEGVERDVEEAHRFFLLAAAQGHQGAQANLATLQSALARR